MILSNDVIENTKARSFTGLKQPVPDLAYSHSIVNEPRKFSTDAGLPVATPGNTMKNTMIRSY